MINLRLGRFSGVSWHAHMLRVKSRKSSAVAIVSELARPTLGRWSNDWGSPYNAFFQDKGLDSRNYPKALVELPALLPLVPDNFSTTTQDRGMARFHILNDIGMQRDVWLSADIRYIDADSPAYGTKYPAAVHRSG